jgi:hypothetical protein
VLETAWGFKSPSGQRENRAMSAVFFWAPEEDLNGSRRRAIARKSAQGCARKAADAARKERSGRSRLEGKSPFRKLRKPRDERERARGDVIRKLYNYNSVNSVHRFFMPQLGEICGFIKAKAGLTRPFVFGAVRFIRAPADHGSGRSDLYA